MKNKIRLTTYGNGKVHELNVRNRFLWHGSYINWKYGKATSHWRFDNIIGYMYNDYQGRDSTGLGQQSVYKLNSQLFGESLTLKHDRQS